MREGRPSSTAVLVALAVAEEERKARARGEASGPAWADLLLRASGVSRFTRSAPGFVLRVAETFTVPRLSRHFIRRKAWIQGAVRKMIAKGIRRVVVVGAGLDTLTLRLAPEFPEVAFVEIDHPASQRAKRSVLQAHPEAGARVELVAADLGAVPDLAAFFASGPLASDLPTVFIAEGLLMYLEQSNVNTLMAAMAAAPGARRVVFSFLNSDGPGPASMLGQRPLARLYLAWKGEPFRSSMKGSALAETIAPLGWTLQKLETFGRPTGECLAIASVTAHDASTPPLPA